MPFLGPRWPRVGGGQALPSGGPWPAAAVDLQHARPGAVCRVCVRSAGSACVPRGTLVHFWPLGPGGGHPGRRQSLRRIRTDRSVGSACSFRERCSLSQQPAPCCTAVVARAPIEEPAQQMQDAVIGDLAVVLAVVP